MILSQIEFIFEHCFRYLFRVEFKILGIICLMGFSNVAAMIAGQVQYLIAGRPTGPSLTAVGATPTLPLVVGFFRLSVFLSCPTPGCLNIRLGARAIASGLRGKIREISTYV